MPGKFGVFYNVNRPTKNKLEEGVNDNAREKLNGKKDWEILDSTFARMK